MSELKRIKTALISVYHKNNLDLIIRKLNELKIDIISTGGTAKFIKDLSVPVTEVESITDYPSILGGRVKTLHPKVFGGILARRDNMSDINQMEEYKIPAIDLVIVDLYPFEETVKSGALEDEIIEKIDIGGISLIRAAAKNYKDVLIVSSQSQYDDLLVLLNENSGNTSLNNRRLFASEAFNVSSHYDTAIFNYFDNGRSNLIKESIQQNKQLRYGENPHQKGFFHGNLDELFEQIHGKEISYNNLLDIDAAVNLIADFNTTTFAILKHNNACGLASRDNLLDAYNNALAGDPLSAFGGVLIANEIIDKDTASEMNKLFFEVIIAPSYSAEALDILKVKKNRIILKQKSGLKSLKLYRSLLNGVISQDKDLKTESVEDLNTVTSVSPTQNQINDLLFANKIVKHSKSNSIVLAKNGQLVASGVGQTSRVDALKHAIEKAKSFNLDLKGAVMASDAFFPFADSIEIAHEAGIVSVIQPGGSIRDKDTISFCNDNGISMVFSGIRHFKH